MKRLRRHLGVSVATTVIAFVSSAGNAQTRPAGNPIGTTDQGPAASDTTASANQPGPATIGDIIVTARKRAESALSIPTAITAISGDTLEQRGLKSIQEISTYTPGMSALQASTGLQHADRAFQNIIIRGMNPASFNTPTTSVFINGTPVGSSDFISTLDDVDRVEILKGPQSAFFGRATFAGAVNVISTTPSNTWKSDFRGEAGSRNTYLGSGNVSGPIITDTLLVNFGVKYDAHDGSYTNADNRSETLGDQESLSFHAGVTLKPTRNLTIRGYGLLFRNNDGPGPIGVYQTTAVQFNQGNCVVAGTPFLCGTLPGLLYNITPAQNTTVTPAIAAFLDNPGGILSRSQGIKGFGLKRDAYHVDVSVEYVVPDLGLTITNLFGHNENKFSNLYDLSNLDTTATGPYKGFFPVIVPGTAGGFPYYLQISRRDTSEEIRIATDSGKPFRALFGYSYINTRSVNASGVAVGPGSLATGANPAESETQGGFFSLAYDFNRALTLSVEGRYQSDRESVFNYLNALQATVVSTNFLPRASLQYKFTPGMMAYFTFSKGANPAAFDSFYNNLPAVSKAKIASVGIVASSFAKPELITNYEVGVKGRFLGGRATIALDGYYDIWTDQINSGSYTFDPADPANPFNVPGPTFVPGNTRPDPTAFFTNSARSIAKGVEFEGNLIPVDHVTLNLSAAYTETKYTAYICTSCRPYASFNSVGRYLPNAPLFSSTLGVMYSNRTRLFARGMEWFMRGDFIYRDGVWIDSANTAKTPNTEIVNFRGGIALDNGLSLEGYVNNAFNEKAPTSGYASNGFSAVSVGLPALVTAGVRVRLKI